MSEATQNTGITTEPAEAKITPKKILVAIVSKFAETNVDLTALLGSDLAQKVAAFYEGIKTTTVRGLPVAERLALVQGLIRAHYEKMPSLDDVEAHGVWSYESMKILQRQERIHREIKEGGAHPEPKTKEEKAAAKAAKAESGK